MFVPVDFVILFYEGEGPLEVSVKFRNFTDILRRLFLLCVINTVVAGKKRGFEFCSEIMALQVPIWTATYSFRFFFCRSLL